MPSETALDEAIEGIASVEGIAMDPNDLAEDVLLLGIAFPDEASFTAAALSTQRALEQLVAQALTPATLKDELDGWQSYHYQHKRKQGAQADMRIVFRHREGVVQVRGFGHRAVPSDIYHRLVTARS